MVLALGTFLFGNPFGFLEGYPYRTFTPAQRLLTEARVLVFYVSQIFYPVPTRLSLYHDFSFSTSLIHPWTTLPCIGFILLLVFIGAYGMGRRPILSFAILFFFINHLIESTVIGLELVFEHRNYLPSLFVFMPISIGIMHITNHYRVSSPGMLRILRTAVVLIIIGFGMGTYVRNLAWADEKTLWEDTLMKSPNSIRAHHELAYQFYEKHGYYDAALALYHRGLDLSGQNIYEKTLSLNNIASIHFTRGEYSQAEAYWERAIASFPGYHKAWYCLSLTQTKMGKWKEAAQNLSTVFKNESSNGNYLQLHGAILLYNNKPLEAIAYFKKVIKLDPSNWKNLICLGSAFDMIGNFDKGYHFLEMANAAHPNDPLIRLLQAQNRLAVGGEEQAGAYLDRFIERVGPGRAEEYLRRLAAENKHLSLAVDDIQPKISLKIRIFGDDAIQPSKAARS
jgi:tetratricopeptide (TPR) repeat protein